MQAVGARVVMVKEAELEEATGPGNMLSETAKEKLQTAQVVAVGAHEDV